MSGELREGAQAGALRFGGPTRYIGITTAALLKDWRY
jgi:hypothetical protein